MIESWYFWSIFIMISFLFLKFVVFETIKDLMEKRINKDLEDKIFTYKEHQAKIHYSAADNVFYGKLENVSDLVSFEGRTLKKAEEAFRDAVDVYIKFCRDIGK